MSSGTGSLDVSIRLNAVIVAVTEDTPRVLTVSSEEGFFLPFGPLDPSGDATLELSLRRWVHEQTGMSLGYVEQLYTFGDRDREPGERLLGHRVISVAYLALVREDRALATPGASWRDVYRFFPWEDGRGGRRPLIETSIAPALQAWAGAATDPSRRQSRRERVDIAFGLGGAPWDGYRVLDRYELLYEAGLISEAARDRQLQATPNEDTRQREIAGPDSAGPGSVGSERVGQQAAGTASSGESVPEATRPSRPMLFDHRRILATALGRLRGKLRYRPVVFELLPPGFTLFQLQRVVEALAGVELHKGNFRRLVENAGLVEGTGKMDAQTGGRPAELFRFRREVLRERPAPGVGLPGVRG